MIKEDNMEQEQVKKIVETAIKQAILGVSFIIIGVGLLYYIINVNYFTVENMIKEVPQKYQIYTAMGYAFLFVMGAFIFIAGTVALFSLDSKDKIFEEDKRRKDGIIKQKKERR